MKVEGRLSFFDNGAATRPARGTLCLSKRTPGGNKYHIVFECRQVSRKMPLEVEADLRVLSEYETQGKATFISDSLSVCISEANPTLLKRIIHLVIRVRNGERIDNLAIRSGPRPHHPAKMILEGNQQAAHFFRHAANPNLDELSFSKCKFRKLRPEAFAYKGVETFTMFNCKFEPEPDVTLDQFFSNFRLINRLSSLTVLNLSRSPIAPQYLCIPNTVKQLNISYNKLITYLPKSVYQHPTLQVLDLKKCSLKSLTPKIANLKTLRMLDLSDNPLTYLPGSMVSLRLDSFNTGSCPYHRNEQWYSEEKQPPTLESFAWACFRNIDPKTIKLGENALPPATVAKINNWPRLIPPPVIISGESSVGQCHTCGCHLPMSAMIFKFKFVSPLTFSTYTDAGFVPMKYELCRRCSEFS